MINLLCVFTVSDDVWGYCPHMWVKSLRHNMSALTWLKVNRASLKMMMIIKQQSCYMWHLSSELLLKLNQTGVSGI